MAEEVRRSGRDVTVVAVHNVARVEVLVDALIVVPGAGTEIGKLPRMLRRLNILKSNDPVLKCAFTVMYPGQQYTAERAKMSIQRFNGFSGDLEQKASSFSKLWIRRPSALWVVSSTFPRPRRKTSPRIGWSLFSRVRKRRTWIL
jgi:hypothetical protein